MIELLGCNQQSPKHPRPDASDQALGFGNAQIERKSGRQHSHFKRQGKPVIVPQAEPDDRATRPERQIGHMHQKVRHPV